MTKPIALECPEIQAALCADEAGEKYVVLALDDKVQLRLCLEAGLGMFDMLGDCLYEAGVLEDDDEDDNSHGRLH